MEKENQREPKIFLSFLACAGKWVIILFIRNKKLWKKK